MGRKKCAIEYVKVDQEHEEQFKVVLTGQKLSEEEIYEFIQMCGRVAEKRREYLKELEKAEPDDEVKAVVTGETEVEDIENIKVGGTC